ncbi:alpha-N-acetylneuraminide alpha-2,8-sialyltransferase-like [Engraulis encrasicolus]|uniref:alpha-N-acetylneuraminide alpha-2,8-sialyltransferase-like n=1 Tax=Engraulis encrasicolus TaxID=184585 RepID=UPI002FD5384F
MDCIKKSTLLLFTLGLLGILYLWIVHIDRYVMSPDFLQLKKTKHHSGCRGTTLHFPLPNQKGVGSKSNVSCGDSVIDKMMEGYSLNWNRNETNSQQFRVLLTNKWHGASKAVVTQANTPVGSTVTYDGESKRKLKLTLKVDAELFSLFPKESPFVNKTWDTCSVVGNGGILTNSSCGPLIDSAQFVIRCNLPPIENDYEKDVGSKSDLVTANPSIIHDKFNDLVWRRKPFIDKLRSYGNALIFLPAFSYSQNTARSQRASYTAEEFQSPARLVYMSPEYLRNVALFWNSQGIRAKRLSTGLIVTSLALELCSNVHLYGFWPFSKHPHTCQALTNHYYDDAQFKKNSHAMPSEFGLLLRLHNQGILRLHLGQCPSCS